MAAEAYTAFILSGALAINLLHLPLDCITLHVSLPSW